MSPLLSEFIIARALCFVKNFYFLGRWWELNPPSLKANVSKGATLLYLSLLIGGSPFYLTAVYTLIVSYFKEFVKGFPTFSRNFFSKAPTPVLHSQWQAIICGYFLPLTIIIITDFLEKSIPFSKIFLKIFFRRCSSKFSFLKK